MLKPICVFIANHIVHNIYVTFNLLTWTFIYIGSYETVTVAAHNKDKSYSPGLKLKPSLHAP